MTAHRNNYGIVISVLVHMLILAIPVSIVVTRNFKEVELFIIDERPIVPEVKKIVKEPQKKEASTPVVKEQPVKEVVEPIVKDVEDAPSKISEVIEPVGESHNEKAITIQPAAVFQMPKTIESPTPAVKPVPVEDVEFGSATGPAFKHKEMPVYPPMARRLGKEGRVLLRLTIDENGKLLNVEVLEGAGFGFTEAAVEAVKKSTFLPAIKDGRSIMSRALLPIKFTLRRAE